MKEAFYFSHDSNSRHDPKIIKLRMKLGWQGYGIFWALIELLRDQKEYCMRLDYESIAYALQTDSEIVKSIINDFDLFELSDEFFYSKSLLERMKIKDERSEKARESANKRWNKGNNANAMRTHSEPNAIKEKKVKEIKINDQILNIDSHNEIFRKLWISDQWIESLCIKWNCESNELKQHLNEFRQECIVKDQLKVDDKDAKSHFVNWVKKGNPVKTEKPKTIVLESKRINRNPE